MTLLVLVEAPKDAPPPANNLPTGVEFSQEEGVTIVTFPSAIKAFELAAKTADAPSPTPA